MKNDPDSTNHPIREQAPSDEHGVDECTPAGTFHADEQWLPFIGHPAIDVANHHPTEYDLDGVRVMTVGRFTNELAGGVDLSLFGRRAKDIHQAQELAVPIGLADDVDLVRADEEPRGE